VVPVTNPWFTEADLAEIDVVAHALEDAIHAHRGRCSSCRETKRFCPPLTEAVEDALGP
jgi:hypothetical protein